MTLGTRQPTRGQLLFLGTNMTYILKSSKLDILESGDFPVLPVWWDMMPLLPCEGNIEPENWTENRWDM